MPIYDYLCEDCGAVVEEMISISKMESGWTPLCRECFSTNVKRVQSTPHIHTEKSPFDAINRGPGGRIYSGPYAKSKTTDH